MGSTLEERDINIIGGFEGSNIHNISMIRDGHFSCEMKPEMPSYFKYPDHNGYWFFLKVENARNRNVTIDIMNCDWMPSHWKHYRPVVAYSDPNMLETHQWERVNKTSRFRKRFRFSHDYREDAAWVALRYPYTYSYHCKYIESLEVKPFATVETIGMTREGRNIDAVTITDEDTPSAAKKKVVVYAREHGVEQEGSWVCQGAIDFLLSNTAAARALRKKAIFLLIPVSMPDAVYHGRCTDPGTAEFIGCDMTRNDIDNMKMNESRALWEKVSTLASKEGPIDICISLHSPHGWEENIWSNLHDTIKTREGKRLNRAIFDNCNGYTKKGPERRWGKFSLPGRCAREFKSIALLLEINQHAKKKFLYIDDLHNIGEAICKGINDYFNHEGEKQ